LVSVVATHILSIRTVGIKDYISRYISLNPINLFVGLLEIVSEITKVISLSFRLFGNVFAGEIVLGTVSTLFAFLFPLPFLMLEVIVGLVQALVFAMLTMAFMAVLMTPHHEEAKEVSNK
jgi:F-type H+-transporting ATPase subunit a